MKPLIGWGLGGPCVRSRGPGTGQRARLGEPSWSPARLLRDLELRLGLPRAEQGAAVRVPSWSSRVAAHLASTPSTPSTPSAPSAPTASAPPFYSRSFAVDPLGTSMTLLAWRDGLVEAGWDGRPVPGGGDRLEALAAIEGQSADALPIGAVDRLVRIEAELRRSNARLYEGLVLVEERALWSTRWQSIFSLLEQRGTSVEPLTNELPGAPPATDLGILQRMLRGELPSQRARAGAAIRGDGTLLLLRGDTCGELAELTAALLAKHRDGAIVVRCADAASLEPALARHGLPQQGHAGSSAWRPAMQLLPLALELAYEPRDPYRVLELLTLPIGPFQGMLGAQLARAVARQPGVGGTEWKRQKAKAAERLTASEVRRLTKAGSTEADAMVAAAARVAERMQRVAEWVEAAGAGAGGAPRAALLAVAARVSGFLQKRRRGPDDAETYDETYGAAYGQARAMVDALARDAREVLSREEMRHLLDGVVRGAEAADLTLERAGRIDHVDHPSALLAPASTVVFWSFVGGTERRPALPPWQRTERAALEAAGVVFPDPAKLLAVESDAWRRGILAARDRVIFVIPSTIKATAVSPHPTWDEIAARLGLEDEKAGACITHASHAILAGRGDALVAVGPLQPLRLPEARHAWALPASRIGADDVLETSATALDTLASCPLRFVLGQYARLRSGALAKVAGGPLLNGSLGHRLVEELHREKAFDLTEDDVFEGRANALLGDLLKTEGATLLLEGAGFERSQLVPQLVRAMRELRRYLVTAGWRIAAVEESVETLSTIGTLRGRLDVRLVNDAGKEAVLDLKWGESTYRDLLQGGRAVQLAAYVRAIHIKDGKRSLPPAAYFALQSGKVLTSDARMKATKTMDGAALDDTWNRVEKTARAVQTSLRAGKVFVAATRCAPLLLDALAIPQSEQGSHYALGKPDDACKYCDYDAICGKAWEAVR